MNNFILTIAIPTYNRSGFLKRSLESLYLQKSDLLDVEIIVSDNASTDDTEQVVNDYKEKGLVLNYIKNIQNRGSDFNISQCYDLAKGKYVVALGDDDFFRVGTVKQVLKFLYQKDYGVVFLEADNFTNQVYLNTIDIRAVEFDSSINFIEKLHYYVTFISGNIVNKQYYDKAFVSKYQGTTLIQVSFILEAILKAHANLYVTGGLLVSEPDNSGGYNLFKIFGEDFNKIIDEARVNKDLIKKIKRIINNNLLMIFFPEFILKLKKKHLFEKVAPITYLQPVFKKYINFWLCCYPLCKLPQKAAVAYGYIVKIYAKTGAIKKNILRSLDG